MPGSARYGDPLPGAGEHPLGQVDADQAPRVRRDERPAEPGTAAGIQDVEASRRVDALVREHLRHEGRRAIREARELRVEAGREAVERLLDERVGRP